MEKIINENEELLNQAMTLLIKVWMNSGSESKDMMDRLDAITDDLSGVIADNYGR